MTLPNVTPWPSESIWQAILPSWPGFTVEVVPEIDSTNAELMRRAHAGRMDPVLLVARHQSAGRGRLGRHWHDSPCQYGPGSLMFSLGLPLTPKDWSGLSLAVGLSVAKSLHPDIMLKWPNDLWWHERKLAGILIETVNSGDASTFAGRYVVIGVGLNIVRPQVPGLSTEPAGMIELLPQLSAMLALETIAAPLVAAILTFEQSGFSPLQSEFNARDALAQVAVTLSDGVSGVAQGVDDVGALLVQTAQGLLRVTSAEVSVRAMRDPDNQLF